MAHQIYAGADETWTFPVQELVDGVWQDIPQAQLQSMTFTHRVAPLGGQTAVLETTATATADGEITVEYTDAQTATLAPGAYQEVVICDDLTDRDLIVQDVVIVSSIPATPAPPGD